MLEWGNVFRRNPDFKLSDLKPVTTEPEPLYSGKSIFSTVLPKDLNMQLKSNFCRKCEDGCKEEDCDYDAYVNIVNGELVSGVLDEKNIHFIIIHFYSNFISDDFCKITPGQ